MLEFVNGSIMRKTFPIKKRGEIRFAPLPHRPICVANTAQIGLCYKDASSRHSSATEVVRTRSSRRHDASSLVLASFSTDSSPHLCCKGTVIRGNSLNPSVWGKRRCGCVMFMNGR